MSIMEWEGNERTTLFPGSLPGAPEAAGKEPRNEVDERKEKKKLNGKETKLIGAKVSEVDGRERKCSEWKRKKVDSRGMV